jgi:hypothetical protein
MLSPQSSPPFLKRRVVQLFSFCSFLFFCIVIGCNCTPIESLPDGSEQNKDSYCTLSSIDRKIDILFVIDNSQSMGEEQAKLRNNFRRFIEELLTQDISDFQIGVITTDMDPIFNQEGRGRLVRADANTPKIITSLLTTTQIIEFFTKNANVGELGSNFEKPLEAIRAALDPDPQFGGLIHDPAANKGFLRDGALLAIIIVSDEDDCSHSGLSEDKAPSSCHIPPSVTLTDERGNPIIGEDGQHERGQMDKLTRVSDFLDSLKRLNRDVIVSGLIGPPFIYRPDTDTPIDPIGGCKQDIECGGGGAQCAYLTSTNPPERRCGGCSSVDGIATAGFRLYEFISKSTSGDPSQHWFSICGNNEGFSQALLRFAKHIIDHRSRHTFFVSSLKHPESRVVRVIHPDGSVENIPKAEATGVCKADGRCDGDQECGSDHQCYRDGWFYLLPSEDFGQHRIRLVGTARKQLQPGSRISTTCRTNFP